MVGVNEALLDGLPPWMRPTVQVAAGVVFTDHRGRVLLVEQTYKDSWDLPGGVVEVGESPLAAAAREINEELGLEVPLGRLMCVDHRPRVRGVRSDALKFLFDGGQLTGPQLEGIAMAPDEIRAWRFVGRDDLHHYAIPALANRIRAALSGHAYLEDGEPPAAQRHVRPAVPEPTRTADDEPTTDR